MVANARLGNTKNMNSVLESEESELNQLEVLPAEFVDFMHICNTKLTAGWVSNISCHNCDVLITQVSKIWYLGTSTNDLNGYLFCSEVGIIASKLRCSIMSIELTLSFPTASFWAFSLKDFWAFGSKYFHEHLVSSKLFWAEPLLMQVRGDVWRLVRVEDENLHSNWFWVIRWGSRNFAGRTLVLSQS